MYLNKKELEDLRQVAVKLNNFCLHLIEQIANGDKIKETDLTKQLIEHMCKPLEEIKYDEND